jgi:hypothetical protein
MKRGEKCGDADAVSKIDTPRCYICNDNPQEVDKSMRLPNVVPLDLGRVGLDIVSCS